MPRFAVIPAALLFVAIAHGKTTYDEHVLPVFQQACLNCHNPDKTKGGLDLSSYQAAMRGGSGGKIVEPGDPASKLISLVRQTAEPKMPPEGEKLSAEQIQILTRWIEDGLPENPSSSARKPSRPKFDPPPRSDPAAKPDGPPPMPVQLPLEPFVTTEHGSAVRALALSPWAPLLAATGQRQVLLHHSESLELVGILSFPEGDPVSLAFTPDARHLIVGGGLPGKSGLTVIFDVATGKRLLEAGREFDSILAADIRPGFDIVATGGPSRLLKLWDASSGELLKSVKKHTDWITALDISPDGVLLASGDRNGGVWVWESETGNEFHTLRGHQAGITSAVFRGDSNILGTASADGTLRFWEMNGGSEVRKQDAHPGGVTAFAFGNDGSSLSAGRDLKARLWKPDFSPAREISGRLPALPTAVALDNERKRAFIGTASGSIHVYHTDDGKPLGEIPTNPPSLATRIAALNTLIAKAGENLATTSRNLAAATITRDQAAKSLESAQNAHHQAIEIHKAAEADSQKNPGETSAKLASDAASRIGPATEELEKRQRELTTAQTAFDAATKARQNASDSLARLTRDRTRWAAATLNTHAIAADQLAESSSLDARSARTSFTETARKLSQQAGILRLKRHQRTLLATNTPPPVPYPALSETSATLAAIDLTIDRELAAYRKLETELLDLSAAIGPAVSLSHQKKLEAANLRQACLALGK